MRAQLRLVDAVLAHQTRLASWPEDLPPLFGTNDLPSLFLGGNAMKLLDIRDD